VGAAARWEHPKDWSKYTEGQHPFLEKPPLEKTPGYGQSAGVIAVEKDGRVWVVEPHNHFAGYEHTFPKGGVKPIRAAMSATTTASYRRRDAARHPREHR
jgi:hypothetical protein